VVPWLFGAVKILGGAYLVYLGISLWIGRGHGSSKALRNAAGSGASGYIRGVLTNLTNPKSAAYYGSIFALFMGPDAPSWVQAAAVVYVTASSIAWYAAVAAFFSSDGIRRWYDLVRRPIDRVAGAVLVTFGARLMLVRD
jgi:threonine/homoserine/homoserine lactone efflux protein